jgi:hypothetical protein
LSTKSALTFFVPVTDEVRHLAQPMLYGATGSGTSTSEGIMRNTLLLSSSVLLVLAALACEPPVSDDATVTVDGRALDTEGNPLADQEIKLWRSGVPLFDSDGAVGILVDIGQPFRTVKTDAEGRYHFELSGAQANTGQAAWAAYFAVTMTQGSDKMLGVASDEFQFSNQNLSKAIPDMQLWDAGSVTVTDETLTFEWDPTATPEDLDAYILGVDGGSWAEFTTANSLSVSTKVLPAQGTTHRFQVVALGNTLRYRTSFKTFEASNPKGAGIDYKQTDNNNRSATDCVDGNLFDLNDGEFAGAGNVEHFNTSAGDAARCINIDLGAAYALSDILVLNGWVDGLDKAQVTISAKSGEGDWELLDTQEGSTGSLAIYYKHLSELDMTADQIRLEVIGGNARFGSIGEIVVYGDAAE